MTFGIGDRNVAWLKSVAARLQEIVREYGANAIRICAHDDYIRFSIRLTNELLYTARKYDDERWEYTCTTSGSHPINVQDIAGAIEQEERNENNG